MFNVSKKTKPASNLFVLCTGGILANRRLNTLKGGRQERPRECMTLLQTLLFILQSSLVSLGCVGYEFDVFFCYIREA